MNTKNPTALSGRFRAYENLFKKRGKGGDRLKIVSLVVFIFGAGGGT